MSSSLFSTTVHVVKSQHIREYRHATEDDNAVLSLHVKHYRPLNNPDPRPGDVTIIGAHANGFPKEIYEPLWDDILVRCDRAGIRVRGIWVADVAHQGQSGAMNENQLGNDPSWFDHPRDLLSIINHFRGEMPRPLVGIGHSMGGNNIVQLSLIHPRLFHTVILLDPVIQRKSTAASSYMPAFASMIRRDVWKSRQDAFTRMGRSPFYRAWDKRVFEKFIEFGLRELPTATHPIAPTDGQKQDQQPLVESQDQPVTLATTRYQEVLSYFRLARTSASSVLTTNSRSTPVSFSTLPESEFRSPSLPTSETPLSFLQPDTVPSTVQEPFYRPEPVIVFFNLPHLRPSALYIFGRTSPMSTPELRADKMAVTGIGVGGSGGRSTGRVKEVVVDKTGHLVPLEKVGETADAAVDWLKAELARWSSEEQEWVARWDQIPAGKKAMWTDEYERLMKGLGPQFRNGSQVSGEPAEKVTRLDNGIPKSKL